MLLALIGGGVMALGSAFFVEYLDKGIKTPDEIAAHLGIPSLGLIPTIPAKSIVAGGWPLLNNGVPANFEEAFRTVRTNILFSFADDGPRSFVITSTSPGEGKTLVASNLAIGFAQTGQRILLIDADLRRARVHEIFNRPQEPGLSNLLVGDARPTETIGKSIVPGLWVLPAGRVPPNPVELLGSPRFKAFLKSLSEQFDAVVIDSPPVMAVSDAAVLAHLASAVVFVVQADRVNRDTAYKAVEQLQRSRAHLVGAILNRVDLQRNGYYYSQYYRSDYNQYYTSANA
jgi:capsular exopolysaccharide synthesis family protein